jgi:hypothetical protein
MEGKTIFGAALLLFSGIGAGISIHSHFVGKREEDDLKLEDNNRLQDAFKRLDVVRDETFGSLTECGREKLVFLRNDAGNMASMVQGMDRKVLSKAKVLQYFKQKEPATDHVFELKKISDSLKNANIRDLEKAKGTLSALGAYGGTQSFGNIAFSKALLNLENMASSSLTLAYLRGENIDSKRVKSMGSYYLLGELTPEGLDTLTDPSKRPASIEDLPPQTSLGDVITAVDVIRDKLRDIKTVAESWRDTKRRLLSVFQNLTIGILSAKGEKSYDLYLRDDQAKNAAVIWLKLTNVLKIITDEPILNNKGSLTESKEIVDIKKLLDSLKKIGYS